MCPVPVYAVGIAKGGLRIRKSQNPPDEDAPYHSANMSEHEWRYRDQMPLSRLIGFLRFELDRPMVDLTGLEGFYDVDLRWPREEPAGGPGPDAGNMGTLFAAMEKQLGLKVEPKKLPFEMVVIDRVDRVPTEN